MNTQAKQEEFVEFDDIDTVQYLTFRVNGEAFSTEIDNVREVLEITKITRVPRTPEYMLGVINLRGSVVPVVDLRLQFGMPLGERTVDSCIIIIEVEIEDTLAIVGMLADSVQEVINLLPNQLSAAPTLGTCISNDYIQSMGKNDDNFVIILNLDILFSINADVFTNLAERYQNNLDGSVSEQDLGASANDEVVD